VADATMSYAYALRSVVLHDLQSESHPMMHDLCEFHAESIRVPNGWTLRDERQTHSLGERSERFAG
jgi:hypothetical protein